MFGSKKAKRSADRDLLATYLPILGGEVGKDDKLRGRYHDRPVAVWFERIDPRPAMYDDDGPYDDKVDVIRLRFEAVGQTPWYVRAERMLTLHREYVYDFVDESANYVLLKVSPFQDMIAKPDPGVEQHLRDAGLMDAIEAIATPQSAYVPRVRFTPDPRAAMKAAMMQRLSPDAMAKLPPEATRDHDDDADVGLMADVPRGLVDLSPDGLAALLDSAVAVLELNERVNPPAG